MKVALLSYLFDHQSGGGAPRSAYFLAKGLAQEGARVVVITTHQGPDERVEEEGLTIYRLHPRNLYWVGVKDQRRTHEKVVWQLLDTWNPLMYQATSRILESERPDVVHVQKLRGLSPSVWGASRRVLRAPLVQTCRDYELFSPQGTLTGRVGRMAEDGNPLLAPYRMARARMSTQVDAAIAPSRFTLARLVERGFFPRAAHAVIPNTPGFTRARLRSIATRVTSSSRPEGFRVLYLGRLERTKGIHDLCEVVLALSRDDSSVRLDVLGDGSAAPELRARYASSSHVRFHGVLHGAAKEAFLAEASVMVVPSRWPEVFGNVIPEAFSFGKPVIGTRVGGIPELIQEGRTGFLFEPGNQGELRSHLELLLRTPGLAAGFEAACLEEARRFSVEGLVESHVSLYQKLLVNRSAPDR